MKPPHPLDWSGRRTRSRHEFGPDAFTLVELLVVIAIIGVLVALLLPAVQAAREAGRRTTCINQLKQMGTAAHNLVSAHGTFPTGGIHPWPQIEDYSTAGKPFGPGKQGLSWAFQLLPYLEQNAVHNLGTTDQITNTPVALYFCPSRRPPTRNAFDGFWLMDYAALVPGQSRSQAGDTRFNLLITSGCELESCFWGTPSSSNIWPHQSPLMRTAKEIGPEFQGFWGVIVRSSYLIAIGSQGVASANSPKFMDYAPRIGFQQIEDGASNTAMISEKRIATELDAVAEWYDDRGWSDGWDGDTLRSTLCQPVVDGPRLKNSAVTGLTAGSAHPAGLHVLFADGSARLVSYDVNRETFNRLAHRADSEILDPE